jgi:hypothetical protein
VRRERRTTRKLLREITTAIDNATTLRPWAERELLDAWNLDENGVAAVKAGDGSQLRAARVGLLNGLASLQYRVGAARKQVRHEGRVVVFMPQDDSELLQSRTLAQWHGIAPGLAEIFYAPGTHFTLIRGEEGAQAAGQWLSAEVAARRRS